MLEGGHHSCLYISEVVSCKVAAWGRFDIGVHQPTAGMASDVFLKIAVNVPGK